MLNIYVDQLFLRPNRIEFSNLIKKELVLVNNLDKLPEFYANIKLEGSEKPIVEIISRYQEKINNQKTKTKIKIRNPAIDLGTLCLLLNRNDDKILLKFSNNSKFNF